MSPKTTLACVLVPLLLLAVSQACPAATITVPTQRHTIQGAINNAADGDTVLVSPGTYFENIDFKGKAISVKAVQGSQPVIIDGQSLGPVVTFQNGEGATSVLNGFTIQHGWFVNAPPCYGNGGGVCILHASPTIHHNTIIDNVASDGGGIAVQFGAPLIADNYIGNNNTGVLDNGSGGGIYLYSTTTVRIVDNVIENNLDGFGGGIAMYSGGTPTIIGNIIRGNQATNEGGGVDIEAYSNPYIGQNLIVGNAAADGAGVFWTVPEGWRGPFLVNNTIADNAGDAVYAGGFDPNARMINNIVVTPGAETALYCDEYDNSPPFMQDNDVYSATGLAYEGYCASQTSHRGNISADPLFASPAKGKNYHLQALSPAIDSGTNTAPRLPATDFDDVARILDGNFDGTATVDMGIYEYRPDRTAGSIAAALPQDLRKASAADTAHPPLRRYESVGPGNRRTVQYYDAAGNLIAEIDAHGVFHRMH